MPRQIRSLAERLKARTDSSGGPSACWPWKGALDGKKRYGLIGSGGRFGTPLLTHRVSYEVAHGPIPDGLHVMHICDNTRCVNPPHLRLGTRSDNMKDAVEKGRFKKTGRGSGSTLTEHAVRELRRHGLRNYGDVAAAARFLGVSKGAILSVKSGKAWRWVS